MVPKKSVLLAGTCVWKIRSVACGLSSIKYSKSMAQEGFKSNLEFRYQIMVS